MSPAGSIRARRTTSLFLILTRSCWFICCLLISACTTWTKSGATQTDYYQDESTCDWMARGGGWYDNTLFSHCMMGRGWRKQ